MRGLKRSPLSVSIPMLAFNPVFTAFFSIFFDKRWPDFLGWVGIMLVSAGFYLSRLSKNNGRFDVLQPIKQLKHEPGAQAILGVALLWSLGIHFQKIIIQGSSTVFASITGPAAGALMLFLIGQGTGRIHFTHLRKYFQSLFSTGLFHALSNLAFMQALESGYTPYAAAVKRSNIVFSSVLGSLFYGEAFDRKKAVGITCMVLGIVALVV